MSTLGRSDFDDWYLRSLWTLGTQAGQKRRREEEEDRINNILQAIMAERENRRSSMRGGARPGRQKAARKAAEAALPEPEEDTGQDFASRARRRQEGMRDVLGRAAAAWGGSMPMIGAGSDRFGNIVYPEEMAAADRRAQYAALRSELRNRGIEKWGEAVKPWAEAAAEAARAEREHGFTMEEIGERGRQDRLTLGAEPEEPGMDYLGKVADSFYGLFKELTLSDDPDVKGLSIAQKREEAYKQTKRQLLAERSHTFKPEQRAAIDEQIKLLDDLFYGRRDAPPGTADTYGLDESNPTETGGESPGERKIADEKPWEMASLAGMALAGAGLASRWALPYSALTGTAASLLTRGLMHTDPETENAWANVAGLGGMAATPFTRKHVLAKVWPKSKQAQAYLARKAAQEATQGGTVTRNPLLLPAPTEEDLMGVRRGGYVRPYPSGRPLAYEDVINELWPEPKLLPAPPEELGFVHRGGLFRTHPDLLPSMEELKSQIYPAGQKALPPAPIIRQLAEEMGGQEADANVLWETINHDLKAALGRYPDRDEILNEFRRRMKGRPGVSFDDTGIRINTEGWGVPDTWELRAAHYEAQGMSPDAAKRAALGPMGYPVDELAEQGGPSLRMAERLEDLDFRDFADRFTAARRAGLPLRQAEEFAQSGASLDDLLDVWKNPAYEANRMIYQHRAEAWQPNKPSANRPRLRIRGYNTGQVGVDLPEGAHIPTNRPIPLGPGVAEEVAGEAAETAAIRMGGRMAGRTAVPAITKLGRRLAELIIPASAKLGVAEYMLTPSTAEAPTLPFDTDIASEQVRSNPALATQVIEEAYPIASERTQESLDMIGDIGNAEDVFQVAEIIRRFQLNESGETAMIGSPTLTWERVEDMIEGIAEAAFQRMVNRPSLQEIGQPFQFGATTNVPMGR